MAKEGTPEEYRAELVAAMGADLGTLFADLSDEFAWARTKWQEYEDLFGSEEKVDLLNKAAPAFFASLQRTLLDDILLHICRLTDRASVMGHDTLSLEQVTKAISDASFATAIEPILSDVKARTQMARDFRNKRGAHTDLKVVRGEEVLPGITRAEVGEALAAIHGLLEKVREHYKLSPESFEVIGALGGVDALLGCLGRGVKAREEWMAKLRGGGADPRT